MQHLIFKSRKRLQNWHKMNLNCLGPDLESRLEIVTQVIFTLFADTLTPRPTWKRMDAFLAFQLAAEKSLRSWSWSNLWGTVVR